MKKSSFLTFIFAFLPGAAHMYLGMMKKGALLMSAFFGVIFIGAFFRIELFLFALPVIWFYAFFDALNLKHATPQQQYESEEKFLNSLSGMIDKDFFNKLKIKHSYIGIGIIVLGAYMLFQNFIRPFMYSLYDYVPHLARVIDNLPSLVVSIAIILFGIYLVRGKKEKISEEKDFIEYEGKENEQQ